MSEIYLLQVTGQNEDTLTQEVLGLLGQYHVNVLDIGQAVIHEALSLGVLLELPDASLRQSILASLNALGEKKQVTLWCNPITIAKYEEWVGEQGKQRYIVTLLARKLTAQQVSAVMGVIGEANMVVDNISRLSGRVPLGGEIPEQSMASVELSVRGAVADFDQLRAQFLRLANEMDMDIAFQQDNAFRRNRRVVVFDMDSTLIDAEVIDELAVKAGVGAEVSAITERAMLGELDFKASFIERVALLKGLKESVIADVAENLRLNEGAEELIQILKTLGYKTAIVSGGFNYFGRFLQQKLGIDYVYANELEIENGLITGEVVGRVVDAARKAEIVREIAATEQVSLEQVIAVGDGANDLKMLSIAGLGIAFRAKPLVKETARHSISTLGLDGILYLIGVRDRDRPLLLNKK
ncbi:MAG: phosphoserine phosphatase SerB [Pseudomonadales bacterium]|nr:phosphoserine phosphatase SerB [Pseudomonadales bacterium]